MSQCSLSQEARNIFFDPWIFFIRRSCRASFVVGDSGSRGSVCIAEWSDGRYRATDRCVELELPPIVLEDASIYLANGLLLPDDVQDNVDSLVRDIHRVV